MLKCNDDAVKCRCVLAMIIGAVFDEAKSSCSIVELTASYLLLVERLKVPI